MNVTDLEAYIILSSIPYLGAAKCRTLLNLFGSASAVLKAKSSEISSLPRFERIVPHWNSWEKNYAWDADFKACIKSKIQLIPFTDPQYPQSLLELSDHPIMLYVKGTLKPQDKHSLAVIGTRNASIYGNEMATIISKHLAKKGYTVVSGLARGIDTSAHLGALQTGRTLAVIGSGLDNVYPHENQALADKICQNGAVISEYPMSTPPHKYNFPKRNRIVSGMTTGALLIEAPLDSGAMITMNNALAQKKKLFTLPGRADNESFRGNHLLLKKGHAHLIENAEDILTHYEDFIALPNNSLPLLKPRYNEEELKLLTRMPNEEIGIDALSLLLDIPIQHITRLLMGLVLKKAIKEYPGKLYKKINM